MKRALPWVALAMLTACAHPNAPSRPAPGAERSPSGADATRRAKPREAPKNLILFRAPGFPTVDAPVIGDDTLKAATASFSTFTASRTDELVALLEKHPYDVLVLSYGSAFPIDAWPAIHTFVAHGGGLVVLGGAPFHAPIVGGGTSFLPGTRSPSYAHRLLIGPAEALTMADGTTTYALTLRLTSDKEYPAEHGTAGPRDAVARSLKPVLDAAGTPRGCELLEIDRLRGDAAGARWLFATTNRPLDVPGMTAIFQRALQGATETRVVPHRASVDANESPKLEVTADGAFKLTVLDPRGQAVFSTAGRGTGTVVVDAKLSPGLHQVVVERENGPEPRAARGGFWVRDAALLSTGPKVGVSRDWLTKDGKAFPIMGTTYMASDVHRHFLFEPNPAVWDADFAQMKKHGVNFVRTGLWTGWSRVITERPGGRFVDEGVLSALEAFVATAAKHGIVVCFNVFAFLPTDFGGANPYLDPKALEGQRALVSALARRFAAVPWVHWDLINEPSYAPAKKLWRTAPIGDAFEEAAWKEWLAARHPNQSPWSLAALWNDASDQPLAMPTDADFTREPVHEPVRVGTHPRKARDFRELSEDIVRRWAGRMRASIRSAAGMPLVTLGQDEGGLYERATQHLFADAVDYTSVHTWWQSDDLLWDGALTKVVGKPNLHEEVGLMRLEHHDGTPWRTPDEAAKLFERKVGYAFASRGAGVVEWVWNVNPYMPIDMEATIGIFRPDGTAKPELDVLEKYARFFKEAAPKLEDFEADAVMLVVPHARAFLGLPGAIDATKPVVRVLAERFGIVPATVSDLHIEASRLRDMKLVIVPNPNVLDASAVEALLEASKNGTKVLLTGALTGDSYGRATPGLLSLGFGPSHPVAMVEKTPWSPSGAVAFEGLAQETTLRADAPSTGKLANGNVWHEPLPLELARDREPLVRLLRAALDSARVTPGYHAALTTPTEAGVAGRVLLAPRYALVVLVNERPEPASRRVLVDGRSIDIRVGIKASSLTLVERATGKTVLSSETGT